MEQTQGLPAAIDFMNTFAALTGLAPASEAPRRYLWTDAFAVCNFLGLYRQTNDEEYKKLALLLVDQVHNILGRHRDDDRRKGRVSGLDEQEGKLHPTVGGLRIGKKMNDRGPDDPFDEQLEWDRDGQYYHYLTKWMHALNCVSSITGDPAFRRWAVELAKTAYAKFTYGPSSGDQRRMYWKMSIDLTYPLVASMGHHDPLDGLITYCELQAGLAGGSEGSPDLSGEIQGLAAMCKGKDWTTDDPLGIGGLLTDAYRAAQMMASGTFPQADLLADLLEACRLGLYAYVSMDSLEAPAQYRLAFRELGVSIGLHALEKLQRLIEGKPGVFDKAQSLARQVEILMRYEALAEIIEDFWLDPANREAPGFTDHCDINTVMLATSLAPDGYLVLGIEELPN
ncbi:MAG TPA: hypothetical protein HPP81_02730 [Deltaproteobacteria bacterium]|jgi:hypothetical protein|nr:hypothetical protein [Deltaproteobacteria bacterium]